MTAFIGKYSAKIDDKGRIVFPAAFKGLMPAEGDMRFVVKKNLFADCLDMFTFSEWERQSQEMYGKLNVMFNSEHATLWREFMRDSAVVEPDGKLGRISIPSEMLQSIGITKEVVFSGNGYKVEIWAKERYEASAVPRERLLEIAGKLSENNR